MGVGLGGGEYLALGDDWSEYERQGGAYSSNLIDEWICL